MRLPALLSLFASIFLVSAGTAPAQPAGKEETRFERFRRMSREAEARGLAEPFRGITAEGKVETGLFPLRSTGVSTAPVQAAAATFLRQLTPDQRNRTCFPVDDAEWRKWMNQHFYVRQGVSFQEMSAEQRAAAFGLLRASLSARGLRLSEDIMKLNHTLGELNHDDFEQYGQWLYHVTVMGEPSSNQPWGWQIDGHHLILNYFVLGDQVVMSPVFVGSEPVVARSGKFQGVAVLQEEQAAGLAMLRALREDQRAVAVLKAQKTGNENLTEAFKDNVVIPYAGLPGTALTKEQQQQLLALIGLFVGYLDEGHAQAKLAEVQAHLARTHFAWIGGSADDSTYYFRIHSPVLLIEFDHQRPANLRHLSAAPQLPDRQHIHVVVRTPNGNDYGTDLLRQHYARERH
ncbi:MAG: DUF3500 domain-containing protein [Verrucomicrobia bacterium]|nr:DUF3500 domain-containing protein [Verrucomicrobiota bacterium]